MKEIILEVIEVYKDENIKRFLTDKETKEFARFVITVAIQSAVSSLIKGR